MWRVVGGSGHGHLGERGGKRGMGMGISHDDGSQEEERRGGWVMVVVVVFHDTRHVGVIGDDDDYLRDTTDQPSKKWRGSRGGGGLGRAVPKRPPS